MPAYFVLSYPAALSKLKLIFCIPLDSKSHWKWVSTDHDFLSLRADGL